MLSATLFLPAAGALIIAMFLRGSTARLVAALIATGDFFLSALVFILYDKQENGFQMVERYSDWIPILKVEYFLAIDGLSAPLVLLTGILGLAAVFSSWSIKERRKEYFAWLLLLQTAVMGVFLSQDFILFFIFWELELIPMYFLISIWGGGRKEYSAMKFVIFTFIGSAFMLVGILAMFFSDGVGTFDMTSIASMSSAGYLLPSQFLFLVFFIGFAVKLPVWPLHTWLPDAHTDAPTAVSVMLAGVLLKMGGYGLIRINISMLPEVAQSLSLFIGVLAIINIVYGAMVTFRQTDLKRLIAFSSISHMGYVLLGISAFGGTVSASSVGLTGAAMQMFTHGTITGLLFVMVGLIYDRTHTRHIPDLGGMASRMPFVGVAFVFAGLASLGLPGTSGFVSEIMIFLGAFQAFKVLTIIGVIGILMTAGYILWALQKTLFGPEVARWSNLQDADVVEKIAPTLLIIFILLVGIYPSIIAEIFSIGVEQILIGSF